MESDPRRKLLQPGSDIPALTGVRAIAAFMVFALHGEKEIAAHFPWARDLLADGIAGVNIFFVLSGFLIYWRYADSAALERGWLANYIRSRAARIYPLAILLTLLALWSHGTTDPVIWVRCLTLTQGLTPYMLTHAVIPQAWTLTVEECFYFSAPILMVLCRGPQFKVRLAAMTVLFWAVGLCIYGPNRFLSHNMIFGQCFEFFVGMALADAVARSTPRPERSLPWITVVGIVCMVPCAHLLAVCDNDHTPLIAYIGADIFLMPIPIAIFFYGLIRERGPIRWLLASKPGVFLGKASFAFYLIHFSIVSQFIASLGFGLFADFLLLVGVAALLHVGVEEPLRRLLRGKSRPGRRPATPDAARGAT